MTSLLTALATVINTSVDKVQTTSLDAARHIGMRFHQIGATMSGSCMHNTEDDSLDMNIPRTSKALLDTMRRSHPAIFNAYAKIAEKFVELESKEQTEYLQKQAPTLLLLLKAPTQKKKR